MTGCQLPTMGNSTFPLSARYRDMATAGLLNELEAWRWDLTELDGDPERDPNAWDHPEASRAFIDAHIDAIATELQRRERLRLRATAPAWPSDWPDHRPDAAAIKAALPIPVYLGDHGVALDRRGQRLWAHCPLPGHEERTPSFTVSLDGRLWYCHGCHRGGDLFALHMHLTGDDHFATAITALAAHAGLSTDNGSQGRPPYSEPSLKDTPASVSRYAPEPPATRRPSRRVPGVEYVGGKVVVR